METPTLSPYLTGGLGAMLLAGLYRLLRLAVERRRITAEGSHEEARAEHERRDAEGKYFENERGIGDWALARVKEAHEETERLAERYRRLQIKCSRQADRIERLERVRENLTADVERLKGGG